MTNDLSLVTEPIINEIKLIIDSKINTFLSNYNNRYNLLEKTHRQIMNLPSVRAELNNVHESDSESECDLNKIICQENKINSLKETIVKLKEEIKALKNNKLIEITDNSENEANI